MKFLDFEINNNLIIPENITDSDLNSPNPKFIDNIPNLEILSPYLRHLDLSGRQGYFSQGFNGASSIFAVVDTGINPKHAEFEDRVIDMLCYTGYGKGLDDNGHGTHCAGSIAGKYVGVAPGTKLVSAKVLDATGGGSSADEVFNDVSKALEDLKDWTKNGKHLTGVSLSLSVPKLVLSPAVELRFHNAIKQLVKNNIAVICSAGNSGVEENRYPACYAEPITVGAVNIEDIKSANFVTRNKEIDLCQCGIDVCSAWYAGNNMYTCMSGTSMSTPTVAGIASLIADKFYSIFKRPIEEQILYWMLKMNCKDVDINGVDIKTGAGFCSLQPLVMDLYTANGNKYMTNNNKNIQLRKPINVIDGVTVLPARELFDEVLGGVVTYNNQTKYARFRI